MANDNLNIMQLGFPWKTQDPFLFCVFHNDRFPEGNGELGVKGDLLKGRNIGQDFSGKDGWSMYHGTDVPGFPGHPHRGFETITIVNKGVIDHSDSMGASGRFSAGDVQWMTAGKGVLHSEMFPMLHDDRDNHLQLFQIWLNLPKRSKMVEPHFKMLWNEDVPVYEHHDKDGNKVKVKVIAGKLYDVEPLSPTPDSWAADPANKVAVWTIDLEPGAEWTIPGKEEDVNRSVYFFDGDSMTLDQAELDSHCAVEVLTNDELVVKNGDSPARMLLLQGKPMNEPVVQYGPFVMNSEQEIQQAFADYRQTQFGGWPWPREEMTHGADRGRFAHHADGREENP